MINSIPAQRERAVTRPETGQPLLIRGLAVGGLVGITLCHLVQLPDTFRDSPALGWLFAALSLVAALLAAGLVHADHRLLWSLAGLTAAGALAGYVLTRMVALPFDTDDVGNWLEPLGLVALFVEGGLLGLCIYRLTAPWQPRTGVIKRPEPYTYSSISYRA